MQCKIDTYELTDGTLSGGFALGQLRIRFDRVHDSVIPLGETSPVYFFRGVHKSTIDFVVVRNHGTINAAEAFIIAHDDNVPSSGTVQLISSDGAVTATIQKALIFFQQLDSEIGSTTIHAYHIEGGEFAPITVTPPSGGSDILTETGDYILTEDGQKIATE